MLVRAEVDLDAKRVRFHALRRREPAWQPLCIVAGTRESDNLRGTQLDELVCGYAGADTIAFERLAPRGGHAMLPAHRVLLARRIAEEVLKP